MCYNICMRLYRVVHKTELANMQAENIKELGTAAEKPSSYFNTFNYEPGKNYLHFFFKKRACQHILELNKRRLNISQNGSVLDYFIVSFKVPIEKIKHHTAFGFYTALGEEQRGYDYGVKKRMEAAIEATDFDKNWIYKIEPAILENHIKTEPEKER